MTSVQGWLQIACRYLAAVEDQDLLAGVPLLADEDPGYDCNVPKRLKEAAGRAAQGRRAQEAEERYSRLLEQEDAEARARFQPQMPVDPVLRERVERILEKARERQ